MLVTGLFAQRFCKLRNSHFFCALRTAFEYLSAYFRMYPVGVLLMYDKESPTMRLTSRKNIILSYFEPDNREWVTGEIGVPPLDVSGVAYLLYGAGINNHRY